MDFTINRKMPLILCDHGDTCDEEEHHPLLEKLAEYKKEGATILMATDSRDLIADFNFKIIQKQFDAFGGVIHGNMFGAKITQSYW